MIPNILSIAGSDPSGGAGIQADIKAISANGGYAMAVITALTAQNTTGVKVVEMVSPDTIAAQIAAIRDDIRIDAVKIGMLGDVATIETVVQSLEGLDVPIVLDPVMAAKGGDRLLGAEAVAALRRLLLPRATVVTPNLPEAGDLLEEIAASSVDMMATQGERLFKSGCKAVLMKGGHLEGADVVDLLITVEGLFEFTAARVPSDNTHGTGCTLSTAMATYLGAGRSLPNAVRQAKSYIGHAISAGRRLNVGQGHGPLHHFPDAHPIRDNDAN